MNTTKEAMDEIKKDLLGTYLHGNETFLDLLLIAYFARGHVLVEGPPGTAKTMTAKLLAHRLSKSFKRIQFTTDMLPGDILGANIYLPAKQEFKFVPGPIFADFIVADEINRTPPRTQSALLEAMEERQVTLEGVVHPLPEGFFVLATQNPFDYEGTFPLPEVQLDRFLFKLVVTHNAPDTEVSILNGILDGTLPPPFEKLETVKIDRKKIWGESQKVTVDKSIVSYITRLLEATRQHPMLISGTSVRGGIALGSTSRILAASQGRDFVTPDDIKILALPTLRHRIKPSPEAQIANVSADAILKEILDRVEFPR